MNTYEFTLLVNREPTDDELDQFPDAEIDDVAIEVGGGSPPRVHAEREATSLAAAIAGLVHQLEAFDIHATAVETEDLVTIRDIANRMGRSRESVRLLATGQRGPGGFPPALDAGDGWSLYSWVQVRQWFAQHYDTKTVSDYDQQMAIADHLIRARAMLATAGEAMTIAQVQADGAGRLVLVLEPALPVGQQGA